MAKWFYLIDDSSSGPIEASVLKQLASAGRLKPTDKVRREDMAEWHEAKQVKGLFTDSQPVAKASSAKPTAAQPKIQTAVPTPKRNVVGGDAPTSGAAPSADAVTATAPTTITNPTPKKPATTRDKLLGCGCLIVILLFLLPAIQAARESARKHGGSESSAEQGSQASGEKSIWLFAKGLYTNYTKCIEYPDGSVKCEVWIDDPNAGGVDQVAEDLGIYVWKIGYKCPDAKTAELDVRMSADGLVDGYGKPVDANNTLIGTVKVNDLSEVRKFADEVYYKRAAKPINAALIQSTFSRAHLLGKGH